MTDREFSAIVEALTVFDMANLTENTRLAAEKLAEAGRGEESNAVEPGRKIICITGRNFAGLRQKLRRQPKGRDKITIIAKKINNKLTISAGFSLLTSK